MNLQDYLPVPSIPDHYHKVIFLAASEDKLSLYSSIPPIPDKRGLNDIPSGPFKNPIVYRIFERMSSHDERILKQFMLELNSKEDSEERLAFLDKSPQIRPSKLLREERLEDGPILMRIDPSECGALAFYPTIFVSRFLPPVEYLKKHRLNKLGFDKHRVAEAIPLFQKNGLMRRPSPVSISNVMLLKQEAMKWVKENRLSRKNTGRIKQKDKSNKSKEIILVFWRAFCFLRERNSFEKPRYREVWDAVFQEWYNKEYESKYKNKLFPDLDYDIDEIIVEIERSDIANASVTWYIKRNETKGSYLLASLPAKLSKLKINPPL